MKDLGKTKFCLGLQIEHLKDGVLLHQATYIEKIVKQFYMDKTHPLSTPMVIRSLDVTKDPFRLSECDSEILGPEVPYLSAIGALMYLSTQARPWGCKRSGRTRPLRPGGPTPSILVGIVYTSIHSPKGKEANRPSVET